MPTKKKVVIKKKKQTIKVKQSQKVKVVVNVGNKSKTKTVRRKAATPQQKQPIIINTHVINQPAAQQYEQQQQLQQANQQKQQDYEQLLNVAPVDRNKLFPEKIKQKEYFENELTSKLRQPKQIAIRQPIIPAPQERELDSTSVIKPIIIPRKSHAEQWKNLINSGRKREDKRENAQMEANLLGPLQAEPKEITGIRQHIIDERKRINEAATQIQKAAKKSIKYKKEEVKGVMQNMLNLIVDEQIKSNKDNLIDDLNKTIKINNTMQTNKAAAKIQRMSQAGMKRIEERIKKAKFDELNESLNPQTDVEEAKNEYINVIQQPKENPREVDEAKPEPKQMSKRQQTALIKREAKAKAKAEAEARTPPKLLLKDLQKTAAELNLPISTGSGKKTRRLRRDELIVLIQGMQVNKQRDINSKMGAV